MVDTNIKVSFWRNIAIGAVVLAAVSLLGGCGKKDDSRSYAVLEGRVAQIDPNGLIYMSTYRPKLKSEITIPGTLAPNAEIFINGVTATQEDIRIDDRVKVTGYKDKDNDQIVATKVEITRDEVLEGAPLAPTDNAAATDTAAATETGPQ